ncbi:MAG: NPCBM/NEW2 domain-containing protein, partial [Gemmataceae bacterium]
LGGAVGIVLFLFFLIYLWSRPTPVSKEVFLAQLPEEHVQAGTFNKQGKTPAGNTITVNGATAEKGLLLLPARDGAPASVSYRLGGKYRTFKTTAALDDASQGEFDVTFSVIGDGRILWDFRRPAGAGARAKACSIDVSDVKLLELVVTVRGGFTGTTGFLPVWVDPQLSE